MNPVKLFFTLISIYFYVINDATGAIVISNGTGGGNWTAGATWIGGAEPAAGDDVVIADGDVVNVDANRTCNKLTINADGAGIDFTAFTINSVIALTVTTDIDFALVNSASATFTMAGPGLSQLLISGNFTNYATGGTTTFSLASSSRVRYRGAGAQTIIAVNYGALLSQSIGGRTLASSGTIGVAGVFTPGTNSYTNTGSTIDFNGVATQTVVAFNYNNLTVSNTTTVTLVNAGTIGIAGTFTPAGATTYTVTGSTVNFNGSGGQAIPAFTYNDLTSSSTGARTLASSGTVGVGGTFTPGTNAYTITGSTVSFNGTAAQTVPAFNYNNLTVANTSTVTLAGTGTLGVGGTFTPAAATYTITGSTVSYNGTAAQTVTAFNYNNLTVANTSTVTLAAAGTVGIAGTFTPGTPSYTVTGSTVHFNGGAAQTIPAFTFNNLSQTNTAGVSLTGNVNLNGTLTINSGLFTTTGQNFTLVSNASGTARIAEITGGGAGPNITGNIIMQRYTTGPTQWRFLCSAVSGATIGSWIDDFTTSGFTGSDCPPTNCTGGCSATCNFASVYSYDETVAGTSGNGFVAATNTTNTIDINKGLWVYLGANPLTFDVTGPPNKFTQAPAITFTASGGSDHDGWNQIANPFPSAIDWDDADWTKTNVDDTHYIWNSNGSYASYSTTGGGVNGGTRYIASQQSFWVKANAGSPVISMNEGVKAAAQNPSFLRMAHSPNTSNYPIAFKDFPVPLNTNDIPNSLLLTASGNGYDDEMKILFMPGATNNFDNNADAWKLTNAANVQNFSSVISGNKDLAINCLPALTADVSIPIRLKVPVTGTYSIKRDNILMLPMSSCVILEDKVTASMINLRTTVTYTFTIADTTASPRFILHIYAPIIKSSVKASCAGTNNGLAIARGIGAGPWTYVWRNSLGTIVQTTPGALTADTLYNCAPDTYSVTVNGAFCGTVTDTILVEEPVILASTPSHTNISCFGGNNGFATVAPSGGTSSYSYLWGGGQTTSAVSNLSLGNYSVTVTDAQGCTATSTVVIGQPASALSGTVSPTHVSCFGLSNGLASIAVSGGTSSYSYLWDNGQTTSLAVNLSFGNYSVTITDARGCTTTSTVVIGQPTALSSSVSPTHVTCFGLSNGSASLSASGGTPSYSYLWDNGQTTVAAVNLSFGNYSVTVTDAMGCTTTRTTAITQPTVLTVTTSVNAATCNSFNGYASAAVGGGTSGFSYAWNNGQSAATATGLAAGSYSVVVTDSKGCTTLGTANISNVGGVTASIASTTTVTCNGGSDGSATAAISGGNPGYTYSWNTSPVQTTVSATGLSAVNYNVTVTDGTGCVSIASVTVAEASALISTPSQTNISCFGGNNGIAGVAAAGGIPAYTYLWNNNATTSQISNLTAQTYSVTISDSRGCSKIQTVSVTQPLASLSAGTFQENVACFGENNGSAIVYPSGGTTSYSYLWDDGQTTAVAVNLFPGTYSVTVTDANGCTTSKSVLITEPAVLVNGVSLNNVSCFGENNGSATISSSGGTPAYSYSWNNGQTTASVVNLSAGNYSVTVTDAHGCVAASAVSISQPASGVVAAFTANTYTLDLAASSNVSFTNGSSGATLYQWNFGDASGTIVATNPIHAYTFTGTYTVTLISSAGPCSDVAYNTIVVVNSNPTALKDNFSSSQVNVVYDNSDVFLQFTLNHETQVNIRVYNMIGEVISSQNNLLIKNQKVKLDIPNVSAGIYIAVSEMTDAIVSKKIILPVR